MEGPRFSPYIPSYDQNSTPTHVSNGYLAQSKEGRFTEVTSSNMQLNRIILTEPLLIFKFTESLVFKYYLT